MISYSILRSTVLTIIFLFFSTTLIVGQKSNEKNILKRADLYSAKNSALQYLSDTLILRKFGNISDSIWNFAELGMQEFKSSSLLIRTLEAEGFKVEKGVAGMPTCFVASWGNGKPVIGILGEFDALPGLSQTALSPVQLPLLRALRDMDVDTI
jgi:hypothetical protein